MTFGGFARVRLVTWICFRLIVLCLFNCGMLLLPLFNRKQFIDCSVIQQAINGICSTKTHYSYQAFDMEH